MSEHKGNVDEHDDVAGKYRNYVRLTFTVQLILDGPLK